MIHLSDKRSTLFIAQRNASTTAKETHGALDNPDEGKDGEGQSRPMDKARGGLVGKDGPEGPGNGDRSREVTLRRGERVGGGGTLKEEERKEDKDFGPDAGMVAVGIDTECLERGQDDEDGGPAVVQGEGQVDEEFISKGLWGVVLLDNIVDVCHCRADEERKNKGPDIVVGPPKVDVDGVQNSQEREAPGNRIDNDMLAIGEELVDDSSKKQNVDERPNEVRPGSWGHIGLLAAIVDTIMRAGNGINV